MKYSFDICNTNIMINYDNITIEFNIINIIIMNII